MKVSKKLDGNVCLRVWSKGCHFVKIFCQKFVLGMKARFCGKKPHFWDGMKAEFWWHKIQNFVCGMEANFCGVKAKFWFCGMRAKILWHGSHIFFVAWVPSFDCGMGAKFCGIEADFCLFGVKARFCGIEAKFFLKTKFCFVGVEARFLIFCMKARFLFCWRGS